MLRACLIGKCSAEVGFLEEGRFFYWSSGTCDSPWSPTRGKYSFEDISKEKGLFNVGGTGFPVLTIL